MLETSSLSLEEFVFASRTRKIAVGKQRDVVDAFRTVCWFHCLRRAIGARSVYQMDDLAEGRAASAGESTQNRKSRWRSYSKGRHSPSEPFLTTLGKRHLGSAAAFQHPLWDVLGEPSAHAFPNIALGRLDGAILAIVSDGFRASPDVGLLPEYWNSTRMRMLERRASLDALAVLMVVMNSAVAEGFHVVASKVSLRVCRVLLMLGPWLHEHGLAQPLAEYVEQLVLPKAAHDGYHLAFGSQGFLKCSCQLWEVLKVTTASENSRLTSAEVAVRLTLLLDRHAVDHWIVRVLSKKL